MTKVSYKFYQLKSDVKAMTSENTEPPIDATYQTNLTSVKLTELYLHSHSLLNSREKQFRVPNI